MLDPDNSHNISTRDKAFRINLDHSRYGSFAEIGAGQEVARWFFKVGGAAGTVAKSISAYDMKVSDSIYGKSGRYVSRERLQSMLDYEQRLNLERLHSERGDQTAFFTFADTVAARSYKGAQECHGWMGVKFQAHPRDEDSQVIIHVRMLDRDNNQQQEALGIVGVNLVYAGCFLHHKPHLMVESLLDGLSTERIEIDMIEFAGIEFRHVDNRVMSLRLVQMGLSGAAMFSSSGEVLQPSSVLRKRPVLVERGSFRPVTKVNLNMLDCARKQFAHDVDVAEDEVCELMELTMPNLLAGGEIDLSDFLARVELLAAAGRTVLISDYFEYYRLASYLNQHTVEPVAITLGAGSLYDLFDESYYQELDGGILEAMGRLFTKNFRIYVYPLKSVSSGTLTTVDNIEIRSEFAKLYGYLVGRGAIQALDGADESILHIFSRDVLQRITDGDAAWEEMVPAEIGSLIKSRRFFGYKDVDQTNPALAS